MTREEKIEELAQQLLDKLRSEAGPSLYTYVTSKGLRRVDYDGSIDFISLAEWVYARMG